MRMRSLAVLLLAATLFAVGASPAAAQSADVGVVKTGPGVSAPDSDVTYTIDVQNVGPDTADNVVVSDAIPATMTFASASQTSGPLFSCSVPNVGDGGTISCSIASLASGTAARFSFVLHIPSDAAAG